MIDSLTGTHVYFERKIPMKIVCNSLVNNEGVLKIDEKGNPLISMIDSGDTYLKRVSKYTGVDNVMLYNETTRNIQMCRVGDALNVMVDFVKGTKFFFGAKKIKSTSVSENVFQVSLDEKTPFKVFLEGTEVTHYTVNGNTITVTGSGRILVDEFSVLSVYAYSRNSLLEGDELVIEYAGYDTIWDRDSFMDGTYFESFRGDEITLFESMNLNQNVEKLSYKTSFMNSSHSRVHGISNVVDINTFDSTEAIDLVQNVGSSEFRLILNNVMFGRVVLVNNCKLDNGVSLSFEKEKNQKRLTIPCGNYIDIKLNISTYGEGKYGKGQYGGGDFVYNSARRGDN